MPATALLSSLQAKTLSLGQQAPQTPSTATENHPLLSLSPPELEPLHLIELPLQFLPSTTPPHTPNTPLWRPPHLLQVRMTTPSTPNPPTPSPISNIASTLRHSSGVPPSIISSSPLFFSSPSHSTSTDHPTRPASFPSTDRHANIPNHVLAMVSASPLGGGSISTTPTARLSYQRMSFDHVRMNAARGNAYVSKAWGRMDENEGVEREDLKVELKRMTMKRKREDRVKEKVEEQRRRNRRARGEDSSSEESEEEEDGQLIQQNAQAVSLRPRGEGSVSRPVSILDKDYLRGMNGNYDEAPALPPSPPTANQGRVRTGGRSEVMGEIDNILRRTSGVSKTGEEGNVDAEDMDFSTIDPAVLAENLLDVDEEPLDLNDTIEVAGGTEEEMRVTDEEVTAVEEENTLLAQAKAMLVWFEERGQSAETVLFNNNVNPVTAYAPGTPARMKVELAINLQKRRPPKLDLNVFEQGANTGNAPHQLAIIETMKTYGEEVERWELAVGDTVAAKKLVYYEQQTKIMMEIVDRLDKDREEKKRADFLEAMHERVMNDGESDGESDSE